MGLVIRIYDIVSPNDFNLSIKGGSTAYPLDSGYLEYSTTYSGGTTQIELTTYGETSNPIEFNTQYWVKITDLITNRHIIENIFINGEIAFDECTCLPPIILTSECFID